MADILKGKSAVNGIAIGKVKVFDTDLKKRLAGYHTGTIAEEEQKYYSARKRAVDDLERTIESTGEKNMKEQLAILDSYRIMMLDPAMEAEVLEKIKSSVSAPLAVLEAGTKMSELFSDLEDPYLKERAVDIRNAAKIINRHLLGDEQIDELFSNAILCADEIDPSVIANTSEGKVTGMIMGSGSVTSHSVIIAKAKGIVTIAGLGDQIARLTNGTEVILDGNTGEIIMNADLDTLQHYTLKIEQQRKQLDYLRSLAQIPAVTKDGTRITVAANISNPNDIEDALKLGCEGVGLFRTEFIFMGKDSYPSEQEQFLVYKEAIERCNGKLCVIRTMDIGGDKPLAYLQSSREENPFLGWRAIRICLDRPDIFITQVKAIYRAAHFGKAAVMLPMISRLKEIHKAKELINQAIDELRGEGKDYSEDVEFGIMIETPSAAIMADVLARECDFFSIGTNDLTQYTLAVDRGNPKVSSLYNYFDPSVLRLINHITKAAHENNIRVGICGEMAGDPAATRLLISIGIDELSMSAPCIPKVKEAILNTAVRKDLTEYVMSLDDVNLVAEYLKRFE